MPNLFVSLSKAWLPWTHKGFSFPVILLFTIVPYFSHQGLSLGHSGFSFKVLLLVTKDQGSTPPFALFWSEVWRTENELTDQTYTRTVSFISTDSTKAYLSSIYKLSFMFASNCQNNICKWYPQDDDNYRPSFIRPDALGYIEYGNIAFNFFKQFKFYFMKKVFIN